MIDNDERYGSRLRRQVGNAIARWAEQEEEPPYAVILSPGHIKEDPAALLDPSLGDNINRVHGLRVVVAEDISDKDIGLCDKQFYDAFSETSVQIPYYEL